MRRISSGSLWRYDVTRKGNPGGSNYNPAPRQHLEVRTLTARACGDVAVIVFISCLKPPLPSKGNTARREACSLGRHLTAGHSIEPSRRTPAFYSVILSPQGTGYPRPCPTASFLRSVVQTFHRQKCIGIRDASCTVPDFARLLGVSLALCLRQTFSWKKRTNLQAQTPAQNQQYAKRVHGSSLL